MNDLVEAELNDSFMPLPGGSPDASLTFTLTPNPNPTLTLTLTLTA